MARALWAFLCCGTSMVMVCLDNLVVLIALPAISRDLGGGIQALEWAVNAYTLTHAVLLLPCAALGDRFGRRRMFLIGLSVFTAASAAAAVAPSVGGLIAARAAQGLGAAILLPLSLPIVTGAVPAHRRGVAIGALSGMEGLAIVLGPLVGGVVVENLPWQWIFWINVPVGLVLLPLVRCTLAEHRGPRVKLDVVGVALASLGLLGIVLGLVLGRSGGARMMVPISAGLAVFAAFVLWELYCAEPMFPVRLVRHRCFSALSLSGLLMHAGLFGAVFLLMQYLQGPLGYSPLETGLRILPWTAVAVVVAPAAGALSDRFDQHRVVGIGLALQMGGLAWIAAAITAGGTYPWCVPGMLLCGFGMSVYLAPCGNLVMSAVPVQDRGIAAGALSSTRELGTVLGIAMLASVFTTWGLPSALWTGVALISVGAVAVIRLRRPCRVQVEA